MQQATLAEHPCSATAYLFAFCRAISQVPERQQPGSADSHQLDFFCCQTSFDIWLMV